MRNPDKGDLAKVLSDEGLDAEVLELDVDDDGSVRSGIGQVLEREGQVDVLINNAGFGGTGATIEESTDEAWQAIISTNLLGPLRCARAVLGSMRERGEGTIVNVSSIAGRMYGMPFTSSYSATKHALCSLSDSIAAEMQDFGVKVACIEPGFFKTEVIEQRHRSPIPAAAPTSRWPAPSRPGTAPASRTAPTPRAWSTRMLAAADGTLPTDTIHHLVGDDAQLFVGGMEQMSYADYQAMGREMIGI